MPELQRNSMNLRKNNCFQPNQKENIAILNFGTLPEGQSNEIMFKEFQVLKQINRILDSSPESQQAKDQKIRSLIIMFKRQLDVNKNLQNKIVVNQKKMQGYQQQLMIRVSQVKNYEKNILQNQSKVLLLEKQNKKLLKTLQESLQQIKIRQDLIQKMKDSYSNQKCSMQNELHLLKKKTLLHFAQKLNFTVSCDKQKETKRSKSCSKSKSKPHLNLQSVKRQSKSDKKNIIRRNILAISKNQHQQNSGEHLLKMFQQNKHLSQRFHQIKKGNYYSQLGNMN